MKGFLIPGLFAAAVMAIAMYVAPPGSIVCGPNSPHGPRIGGVILISGCP